VANILSRRRQAIKTLKLCIRESRKLARQINRKLESLAKWNNAKVLARNELIKLSEEK
jgi:hypothetical protein